MRVDEVDYFGFRKKEYHALAVPATGVLSADEAAFLDEVIDFVCNNNTARTISEFSHQAPWERVGFGDEIPYSSAYELIPSMVSQEAFEMAKEGIREVEEARQKGDTLGRKDFGVFRDRIRQSNSPYPRDPFVEMLVAFEERCRVDPREPGERHPAASLDRNGGFMKVPH